MKHWVTLLFNCQRPIRYNIRQGFKRSSTVEETSCPAPEDQIQVPTGCQKGPGKVLEVIQLHKISTPQASNKGKSEPNGDKK